MTVYHGKNARVYVEEVDLSGAVEQVSVDMSTNLATFQPLSGTSVQREAGHSTTRITFSGTPYTDDNNATMWSIFSGGSEQRWTILPTGLVLGRVAICGTSIGETTSRVAGDNIVRIPLGMASVSNADLGRVLRSPSQSVSPSPSIDNLTDTDNGGLFRVVIYGGTGTLSVTLEHSQNDADWETLTSVGPLTAPTIEEVIVSGTVYRFLRVSWSSSDNPSWFAVFCRR